MKSNDVIINIVVELLKKHEIRRIVISPGGTNIAFIKAVQNDPFFSCYSVVDERSAMYFAIGLYLETGEPIATSCTSAQATRNYVPGLTEAFYKHAPILALSMEKHPRFTGQDYMQAPDQASLPVDSVKRSIQLPYISDYNDYLFCVRLCNEGMLELLHEESGPVQICIPWLDFPQDDVQLKIKDIQRYTHIDAEKFILKNKRIMIVIGEHRPFDVETKKSIEKFCGQFDCVVYTNHLSNYIGEYSIQANLELTAMSAEEFARSYLPDIVITIGGQTGDYPLYKILSSNALPPIEHWRVCKDGKVADTYDKLTKVFQATESDFFGAFYNDEKIVHEYYKKWMKLISKRQYPDNLEFSNVYLAYALHDRIPANSIIQFSILNSLRAWSLFPLNETVKCYSNVSAFGIDGGLSTLIGHSVATDELCFMIIGDLAFYYDMNAIGIRHIRNNLRILLVNNNGGVEFKMGRGDNKAIDCYVAAANHFKNARGWSETCGFKYMEVRTKREFENQMNQFLEKSEQPVVMEVFVTDVDEFSAYEKVIRANRGMAVTDYIKKGIRHIIG